MSKKSKIGRKKNQLTKQEIDAMVREVLDEAAKEAENKADALEEAMPVSAEPEANEPVETPEAESPAAEEPEAVSMTEEPGEAPAAVDQQELKTDAELPASPSAEEHQEMPVESVSQETPDTEASTETTGLNDSDVSLPNADGTSGDPTGSKSVFLTVKENGKLAIAVDKDGDIIYEDNVIPSKPSFFSRFKKLIIAAAAIALLVGGWFAFDNLVPKKITVVINYLENSRTMTKSVACTDVAGALEKIGITLSDIDEVHPFLTERVESGTKIEITKHLEALANVGGENTPIHLIPGTVEDNLAFNNIEYDEDDIVSPPPDEKMTSTSKIVVKDVEVVVKEKEKTIASGSRIILDPSLGSGVYSATEAQDGKALYTYTTTYVNGEDTGTKEEFKEWITKPEDDTIRLGTSVTGNSGEVNIEWTFTSNTTAYYMGEDAYGASGGHCHYGTCAVDPSVIPYGSILWVSGYGFAVANDCGGAIVGTNLDLYMRSTEECYSWGRRYVTAYLLG